MDSKSLSIGIYEHFKDYYNTRGVGIITDKQLVFYTQYNLNDGFNHDTAFPYLDNKIYPNKNYKGFYRSCKDVVIASFQEYVYIDIPTNKLSENQLYALKSVISEINNYNEVALDNRKVTLNIFGSTNNVLVSNDINEINEFLNKFEIRPEIEENEIIIGQVIKSNETII